MKRPITVLGAGRPANSSPNSNTGMVYAVIPLLLGLPIVAYFLAQIYHVRIEQFAPLIFIAIGFGLAAVFFIAAKSQRAEQRAAKKAREASNDLSPTKRSS